MFKNILLKLNLHLFDGGSAGGAAGAAGSSGADGGGASTAAGINGKSGNGRPGNTGETKVIYGRPPEGDGASDAGENAQVDTKERARRYRELIGGEFKAEHTADVQRIIDARFKETKTLQEQLDAQSPIMDMLRERYGVDDPAQLVTQLNSDTSMWAEAAEEAGMTVEQYRRYKAMERQNAQLVAQQRQQLGQQRAQQQLAQWQNEAEQLSAQYPEFDLAAESQNPEFMRLLESHIPMEHAYKLIHMDELMQQTAAESERRTVENIRSRGNRPSEAGASSQPGVTYKSDPSKFTAADRRKIAEEARRGKVIQF